MRRSAVAAAGLVMALVGAGCDSTDPVSTSFRAAGRLPPVPGPARQRSETFPVAGSIVVFGGQPSGGSVPAATGGYLLMAGARQWTPLRGAIQPVIGTGVSVGRGAAVVVGTRCRRDDRIRSVERAGDGEDIEACGGQPLRAYLVEDASAEARRLPDPNVAPGSASFGPASVGGIGLVGGRYYFRVRRPSQGGRESAFLMSIDDEGRRWRRDRMFGGDNATLCISDRRLISLDPESGTVLAVFSPSARRWLRRPGAPLVAASGISSFAPLLQCPRRGPPFAGLEVDARLPSRHATFAELTSALVWRDLPDALYGTPLWTAVPVGTSWVLWQRGVTGYYALLRRGGKGWALKPRPRGTHGQAQPYSRSSLLVVGEQTSPEHSTMSVVRV